MTSLNNCEGNVNTSSRTPNNLPTVYFDSRGMYWRQNAKDEWIPNNERQIIRLLNAHGISSRGNESGFSPADECLLQIQTHQDVQYAGPLAGYRAGVYEMNASRVLVTSSPKLVEPKAGSCDTIQRFFSGLLTDQHHDQTVYFYGWLKIALEALHAGQVRPGQALALCGPRNCGKSLGQNIITKLLGGRSAKPYQFMVGHTHFNAELFGAEHLMIEDEHANTSLRARRHFGTQIKALTVNEDQRCHAKGRTALTLNPFWRLTMSLNDEPENLLTFPPMDDGVTDKFIILKAVKKEMPMPTRTLAERKAFMDQIERELPAFVHFLLNYEIPEQLKCERFGIKHFHHPEILQQLDSLAPESKLLALIDAELFSGCDSQEWNGTAEELETLLLSNQPNAKRILTFDTACGVYLSRLEDKYPERVKKHRTAERRGWIITQRAKNPVTPSSKG